MPSLYFTVSSDVLCLLEKETSINQSCLLLSADLQSLRYYSSGNGKNNFKSKPAVSQKTAN